MRVPLAWRNLVADPAQLARATAGVAFAVTLMMVEIGFGNAYIESMVQLIRRLDGDLVLVSSVKYQFDRVSPFSRRQLYAARAVEGVASVRPLYMKRLESVWRNPQDHTLHAVQAFAFDPDQPVFRLPEIAAQLAALRTPDTVMFDRNDRDILGRVDAGTETELDRHAVKVIGTFWLGPDFFNDGNVVMSDRTYFKIFGGTGADGTDLPDPEVGVIKVAPGYRAAAVQSALRAVLPGDVTVMTRQELIDQEARWQARWSPVGPLFTAGTVIGFAVGMLISYQILFSELADQIPQYATLKAMGYRNAYIVGSVAEQAVWYALVGFAPAWLLSLVLFRTLAAAVVVPLRMTVDLTVESLVLALGMCLLSAFIAVRRVLKTDPAELF